MSASKRHMADARMLFLQTNMKLYAYSHTHKQIYQPKHLYTVLDTSIT